MNITHLDIRKLIDKDKSFEVIANRLLQCRDIQEKLDLLSGDVNVLEYLNSSNSIDKFIYDLSPEREYIAKTIAAIGQGPVVFYIPDGLETDHSSLCDMLDQLYIVDTFYDAIGGIIGYHHMVLKLIIEQEGNFHDKHDMEQYSEPQGINLDEDSVATRKAIIDGIKHTDKMGELYPIGGAGERLGLVDKKTNEPLPAAKLCFGGNTLLEIMIRDLQGREYLYYKLYGEEVITPVAMMTSSEKNNDFHIKAICKASNWFGRPKNSFKFFIQPMVPVITKEGNWSMTGPLHLNMKPGGHGVIWKIAKDAKIFDWFASHRRSKLLVRQVNNPIAGIDNGISGLIGIGCENNKYFGVASCRRAVGSAEGVVIAKEVKSANGYKYGISNIEYTDFLKNGIEDAPVSPTSRYSKFPTNTNILFADINMILSATEKRSYPGMLINMKKKVPYYSADGHYNEVKGGRLETLMQKIADTLLEESDTPPEKKDWDKHKTFLTYNRRIKTLSVTKNSYDPEKPIIETPQGCFYDLLTNMYELLSKYCDIDTPRLENTDKFVENSPPFILCFHPALGPMYSIISQKIHGGTLAYGAEIQLEIAELEMKNIQVDGSMLIIAENIMGPNGPQEDGIYNEEYCGKCSLKNVTVKNGGIDTSTENIYWQNTIARKESLQITLHGNAEFIAENITFVGNKHIEVNSGYRMTAYQEHNDVSYRLEPITTPTWYWRYSTDNDYNIIIKKSD